MSTQGVIILLTGGCKRIIKSKDVQANAAPWSTSTGGDLTSQQSTTTRGTKAS